MKLMVCYNGSPAADAALELAKLQASMFSGSMLFVVTSLVGGKETSVDTISSAERALDSVKADLAGKKIPCETHLLVRGLTPGEDLVRFAKENGVDYIFIGIEKKSKMDKLVFGSTAQYVILEAHCPVVTTK